MEEGARYGKRKLPSLTFDARLLARWIFIEDGAAFFLLRFSLARNLVANLQAKN
jgi:hypothetical protein